MAGAGYTTVTARVVDRNNQPYSNANYSVEFVNLNQVPGSPVPNLGNNAQFQTQIMGNQCDSDGNLSVVLADNNAVSPQPSQWIFTICSRFYPVPRTRFCFVWQGTITGATMDISIPLQAASVLLPIEALSSATALSSITPALAPNTIANANFEQAWGWSLAGPDPKNALIIGENAPSTAPAPTALVAFVTLPGSTAEVFNAVANGGPMPGSGTGLRITPTGDITSTGGAVFIGPVRIPPLANSPALATDSLGDIIASTTTGILSINNDTTPAQQLVAGPGITITSAGPGILIISLSGQIIPPTLGSLTLSPTSVTGGGTVTGTVTLTSGAPGGGAQVTLSSSNAAAQVPASVTIPSGQTSTTFTVTTNIVGSVTIATITGTYGASQSATLTIAPPAQGIYGGGGKPGATSSITQSGNSVILSTGDVLPMLQSTPEQIGQSWPMSNLNNQCVYLLLVGGSHTFIDALTGFPFVFNPPLPATVGGASMYLYQSTNQLFGNYQPKVIS